MSRKQRIPLFKPVKDGDLTESFKGEISTVGQVDRAQYIIKWSSGDAINGEFSIEISDDKETWHKLPFAPEVAVVDVEGIAIVQISEITWQYMRPAWENTSTVAGVLNIDFKASTGGA